MAQPRHQPAQLIQLVQHVLVQRCHTGLFGCHCLPKSNFALENVHSIPIGSYWILLGRPSPKSSHMGINSYTDPSIPKTNCCDLVKQSRANQPPLPIGSMYAIYGNMDPINIPPMLAYIPAPWILWVIALPT